MGNKAPQSRSIRWYKAGRKPGAQRLGTQRLGTQCPGTQRLEAFPGAGSHLVGKRIPGDMNCTELGHGTVLPPEPPRLASNHSRASHVELD